MSEASTSSAHHQAETTLRPSPPWFSWRRISLGRKRRAQRHMKAVAKHTLDALDVTLRLAGDAASDAGVPGLTIALSAVREIVVKIQTMRTNVEGVDTLDARVVSLGSIFEDFLKSRQGVPLSEHTVNQIDELSKTWSDIARRAGDIKSRGKIRRFFASNADAKKLEGLVEEISTSINEKFLVQSILTIKEDVQVMRQDVTAVHEAVQVIDANVDVVREDVHVVREDVEVVVEGLDALNYHVQAVREDVEEVHHDIKGILERSFMSTYAKNAQYDAAGGARRSCLNGTRVGILNRLYAWINAACTRTMAILEAGCVFWINGLAGTGKTTIAVSVAEWSQKRNLLAANFFCSRTDAECSDPNLIFPTLSRQLCHFHAPFKEKITAILHANPDIAHAGPLRQFEELIVKPLEAVKDTFPTSVVVLDALDECLDEEATSIILTAIARYIPRIAGLVLFVITSRPERRITVMFEKAAEDTLKDVTTPLLLHKIDLESVLTDIRRYLEDGLVQKSPFFTVAEGWPATQDVNRLAEMSGGLFIWAATALRFIMDRSFCDPEGQLQSLLAPGSASEPRETILHSLYIQITNAAFAKIAPALSDRLRSILGAIVLAQEPLSVETLVNLVGFTKGVVRNTLIGLGSVLHVPDSDTEAIHIIHLTFREFLLTPSPTKPEVFHITAPDHHLVMFSRCMVIMHGLQRNIAGIKSPSTFKSEVPGLEKTIKECISPSLGYACRYWTTHLVLSAESTQAADSSYDIFYEFLHCRYLYWLEACSLLEVIEGAVNAHYAVLQACQTLGGRFADITPLLVDCRRFSLTYAGCVDVAPLQLYHSALALAPTKSLVKKAYNHDPGTSLIICHEARSEWGPSLNAFTGHGDMSVYTVAFSPSGDCFITGGEDHKLKMWRPTTCTMIMSFDGHTSPVNCVTFSPNGMYIASGSFDGDVRVWQASSGECVQTLKGHEGGVSSMAYSADGQRIICAAYEGKAKMWDLSGGHCILTLDPINKDTRIGQAGISQDGGIIACGNGASLVLHDASSTAYEALDFPERVDATTFSPDGRYVAARSSNTIRVWRFADRSLVRSIDVSDNELSGRLAFSPDGKRIGCGSKNGTMYLWQVASEAPPLILRGHTDFVWELSWSPNGLELVSVSQDNTVRVWDTTQPSTDTEGLTPQHHFLAAGPVRFALARHRDMESLLHLSSPSIDITDFTALATALPNGAPMLTAFVDMADAWDVASWIAGGLPRFTGTSSWAALSGQQHVNSFYFQAPLVAISSDGSLIAYRSPTSDQVVDIYGFHTGEVVTSLTGHAFISSITFSPNGALVATGADSVKVWNSASGVMLPSYDEHIRWNQALVFSPDGHLIAFGSGDETVHVFEAATGRVVQVFKLHPARISEVALTADNARVLILDVDRWLGIWDIETGTRVYELSLKDDSWIHSLNFSSDGTSVLTPGENPPDVLMQSLQKPCNRSWPVYVVSREGWLYEKGPGFTARLCWLPPEWRTIIPLTNGQLCTPHRAAVFDVSQLPDYVCM